MTANIRVLAPEPALVVYPAGAAGCNLRECCDCPLPGTTCKTDLIRGERIAHAGSLMRMPTLKGKHVEVEAARNESIPRPT
ncbi:hypothetical protein DSECCO2_37580 [anaerobic digester metagenome]|jgi:hypothetical protein